MITSIDLSQEIFVIDMLTALKSSLKHRHEYFLQLLLLYGEPGSRGHATRCAQPTCNLFRNPIKPIVVSFVKYVAFLLGHPVFAIDMLRALKSSLKHRCKHVLR